MMSIVPTLVHAAFFRSPSSVDAVMYAYLAPLLKAPYPNNALQNYLNNCDNLVKFVVRISQNYFPQADNPVLLLSFLSAQLECFGIYFMFGY